MAASSSSTRWKPTFFGRVYAAVAAFVGGRRMWVIAALLVVCVAALSLAFKTSGDYWTPIFLEIAVACGLLAALHLFLGTKVSATERVLAGGAAIGLLIFAAAVQGLWRAVLIEAGAGVALFLVLDLYLERRLETFEQHGHERPKLHVIAYELYRSVASWTGETGSQGRLEPEGTIPPGPEPVHVGSEHHRRVIVHNPPALRLGTILPEESAVWPPRPPALPPHLQVKPHSFMVEDPVKTLSEAWAAGLKNGMISRELAEAIATLVDRYLASPIYARHQERDTLTRLAGEVKAHLDGGASSPAPVRVNTLQPPPASGR